jgi:hypothetical protein
VWRVLGKEIALQDWSMPACRWNLSANIMIFAWSEWQLPNSKKDAHRQLLDIAWSTPTPSREFGESTKITHLKFLESKLFVNEGSKPGVIISRPPPWLVSELTSYSRYSDPEQLKKYQNPTHLNYSMRHSPQHDSKPLPLRF